MRRYKMLKTASGPEGVLLIGKEYSLTQAMGDALCAGEAAVCIDARKEVAIDDARETATPPTPENAMLSAPETAVGRGQRKKR